LHNIGQVQHQLGKFKEALEMYAKAMEIVKKELGEKHYKMGMYLNSAGLSRAMMSDYEHAYTDLKVGPTAFAPLTSFPFNSFR
jgi:tetratricopeptide (TPR) repeat protein